MQAIKEHHILFCYPVSRPGLMNEGLVRELFLMERELLGAMPNLDADIIRKFASYN